MAKIARDTPLAELTLRRYEKPTMGDRDLVRKFCLSLGLLQPGDSRDIIVDILHVLINSKELTTRKIEILTIENREKYNLPILGVAPSNIRRQLLRLEDSFLIEKFNNQYRFKENQTLDEIFNEHIEQYFLKSILSRVKEYISEVEKLRK